MKQLFLDCNAVTDKATLHAALKAALSLPEWYGGNLDALHDCLGELSEPTELILQDYPLLTERLGPYAAQFVYVLHVSTEENPHFLVTLS